jgi:hypothetical protein
MFDELSLNILDIGMNSLAAGATILEITVIENRKHDWLIIRLRDNGRGMSAATLKRVLASNATTKASRRKPIGLGLAMLRQTSEMCNGTFHVHSLPGHGTTVTASMRRSHVDRPPLGDLNTTVLALSVTSPDVDVRLAYREDDQTFYFSSQEGQTNEPRRTPQTQGTRPKASLAA